MTPAFGYLRVSGKGQLLDDADGFPRQRAAIERYAAANALEIVGWYEERGVSGTTEWEERPAWVDMMAAIGDVNTVIIERLDRLARDMGVQEHIIRDLKKRRVALMSTAEPDLGSEEPTRVLIRQMLGMIAQYDRAQIVGKLRHGRDRKRRNSGRCEGRKPFGTRPGEEITVAFMERLNRNGLSSRDIAVRMTALGMATRTGKPWSHGTVAKILNARSALAGVSNPPTFAAALPSEAFAPEQHSDLGLFQA